MPFVAGSVEYSGRHDHGVLDIPKQRRRDVGHDYDDIAMLVASCDDAKAFTNEYLTCVIQTEEEEELIMRKQQQPPQIIFNGNRPHSSRNPVHAQLQV